MFRNPVSDAEITGIMQASKDILSDIIWEKNVYENWLKSVVEVNNDLRLNLKLYLNVNSENYNLYSFSLILNNIFCISRFDANGSHKNRHTDKNEWKGVSHKHKWTAQCRDRWAFTPSDIDESSVENAFVSFCVECQISFKGKFNKLPPIQTNLLGFMNDL